jgi:hypothetical protein
VTIQAVKWLAQLQGGGKLSGGQGDPSDVNVSAVPVPLILLFTVSGTTSSDTLYLANNTEHWYRGGRPFTPTFPLVYSLSDGSTLTIDRNSEAAGDLTFIQE